MDIQEYPAKRIAWKSTIFWDEAVKSGRILYCSVQQASALVSGCVSSLYRERTPLQDNLHWIFGDHFSGRADSYFHVTSSSVGTLERDLTLTFRA
jgi:hypothetical protein